MGEGYTFQFADHNYEFSAEFYESLRIWPQTRICYLETTNGWLVAELVSRTPFLPEKYCIEFPTSIPVKWEFKNQNDNG